MTIKIPDAALQQHVAVLGKTGSGKTYAAKGAIVEPLLERGARVGIVDPTGAWWGLRSSRDGKGPGFKILVLGGDHGDLPLPALGGAAVARLLVEQGVNLVADTSQLTVGERTRWFIDFAGTLHRLNKSPLHLILDEAHNFAPQGKVMDPDAGKMLHATNRLAAEGRSRGIRLTMITQRPQKLHKDTLTSADTLIAMRVLAPHDRAAVEDWIKGCGDLAQGKEVLNSLASLSRGEGWVWYPEGGFLQRMRFPTIRTFDSSATPTGGAIQTPKGAADVDLTEIRAALADAVKEAEANDPKLLRARIAQLQRELDKKPAAAATAAPAELAAEYTRGRAEGWEAALHGVAPIADRLSTLSSAITEAIEGFQADLRRFRGSKPILQNRPVVPRQTLQKPRLVTQSTAPARSSISGDLPVGERRVLIAIAQHSAGVTREQLTILTGYKRSSRDAYVQRLAARAYVETGDPIVATKAGVDALGGDFEPLPTGDALRAYWMQRLPEGERRVLEVIVEAYPDTVERDAISERTDYKRSSRDAYLQRLGTRKLIEANRGAVRARDELFHG